MRYRIYDDSCDVFLDDDFYQEYKSKIFIPSTTDEDIYDYMVAHLQLFVHEAVSCAPYFKKDDDPRELAKMILTGSNEEEKQYIYDKCEEGFRDEMEVREFLASEDFKVAVHTMIQEQKRMTDKDVLQKNAYNNPPESIPIPVELFSQDEGEKDGAIKTLFELFKENGIINLNNWVVYYHTFVREAKSVSIDNPGCVNKLDKPEFMAMISRYYRNDNQIEYEMGCGETVDGLKNYDEIPLDTLFEWFRCIIEGIISAIQYIEVLNSEK